MGRAIRARPEHLAKKLCSIREYLGVSQNGLISLMDMEGELRQNDISAYELGKNEPSLIFLLKIVRLVGGKKVTGKYLEMLIDDDLRLRLPKRRRDRRQPQKVSRKGQRISGKRA